MVSDWDEFRWKLIHATAGTKDGHEVPFELSKEYGRLEASDQRKVDQVLAQWVLSDDPTLRFDALSVIGDHQVVAAAPALHDLSLRLEESNEPSAPYEWAKVNRLLRDLASGSDNQS